MIVAPVQSVLARGRNPITQLPREINLNVNTSTSQTPLGLGLEGRMLSGGIARPTAPEETLRSLMIGENPIRTWPQKLMPLK